MQVLAAGEDLAPSGRAVTMAAVISPASRSWELPRGDAGTGVWSHSDTLGHYRAAEEISGSAAAGTASTEDLRLAMIHYRALFGDLLGEPADAGREPAATEPGQVIAVDGTTPGDGDAYAAAARAKAAGDPVAARQHFNGSDAQELTK